jgi:hypothetical protein
VSSTEDLSTPGTPQNQALNYIIDDDPAALCPDDETLIQRYSLFVFYYSTNGDRWQNCNKPANVNDQAAVAQANEDCTIQATNGQGSDAWLTGGSECNYAGIVCDANGNVTQIDIGKFR